jgi:S-methylmethionine-dependent homocysteine/selenocysteine methylase
VERVSEYLSALSSSLQEGGHFLSIGAYANSGSDEGSMGFLPRELPPASYARCAREWMTAGATILGGCCGTRPAHIEALGRLLVEEEDRG